MFFIKDMVNKGLVGALALAISLAGCNPTPLQRSRMNWITGTIIDHGVAGQLDPKTGGDGGPRGGSLQIIELPNGEKGWVNYQGFVIVRLDENSFRTYSLDGERLQNVRGVYTSDNPYEYEVSFNK